MPLEDKTDAASGDEVVSRPVGGAYKADRLGHQVLVVIHAAKRYLGLQTGVYILQKINIPLPPPKPKLISFPTKCLDICNDFKA